MATTAVSTIQNYLRTVWAHLRFQRMVLVAEEWGMLEWHTQLLNGFYWQKERSSDEASVAETAVNFMHCFYVLLCYKHFLWHFPLRHHSSNFGFPFFSFIILRGCFYTFLHIYIYTYIYIYIYILKIVGRWFHQWKFWWNRWAFFGYCETGEMGHFLAKF